MLDEPPPAEDANIPVDPKRENAPRASPETKSTPPAFLGADSDVTVEVGKATKVGEGMSAYASYLVTTSTTSPAFRSETSSVSRRFSDFTRLRKALRAAHPGVIVYPLPEKTVTTSPFHPEFLEHRRVGLDTFARAVAAHPILRRSEHLRAFLEDPGGGLHVSAEDPGGGAGAPSARGAASEAGESASASNSRGAKEAEKASLAAAWYQRGAAGTALSAVDGWFKSAAIAAESFVHGAGADTVLMEEEPDFLEASEYLLAVEDRLKRAVRASDEVVSAVNSGGLVLGNLGDNALFLGDCEERGAKMLLGETAGGLGQAFRQVGAAAISLRAPTEAVAERLAAEFRAPLRRALDLVHAAKETVDARAEALLRLQTTRAQAEKRRAKLEAAVEAGVVNDAASARVGDGSDGAAGVAAASDAGGWFEKLASTTTKVVAAARGPAETVEDLRREVESADAAREHAHARYEAFKATMRVELPRLHAELEAILNAAFGAANVSMRDLAGAQAEAWEAVMPGCSDVAALDSPPADAQHGEGVGAAIARSLAGVMGSAKQGDSPAKAADSR